MSVVNGKDVVLSVKKNNVYYPIACNAVCSLILERDELETTFRDSSEFRSFTTGKINVVLEGSGPIEYAADYTASDVMDAFIFGTLLDWQFQLVDSKGHTSITKTYTGRGFFRSLQLIGDVQQAASCDYTIRVTGDITGAVDPSTVPPILQTLFYTASGGETVIYNPAWVDSDMLEVMRNGIGLEILTSGTPDGSQVVFDSIGGTLTFASGLALAADEYIQTLFEG